MPPSRLPAYLATPLTPSPLGFGRQSAMRRRLWGFFPAVLKSRERRDRFLWGVKHKRRVWRAEHPLVETGVRLAALHSLPQRDRTWGASSPPRKCPEACAPRTPGVCPPPPGGAWKIPTENKDSFLAPSGGRCSISVATWCLGSSGLQRNVTCSVASCHVQDTAHLTSPHQSEVSKLVPLSEKLAAWKLLPNISPWVERTVEKGYRIQFAYRPSAFQRRGLHFREPERVHLLTQRVASSAGAIEHVPLPDRESGYCSRYFWFPRRMGGLRPILDLRGLNRLPQILQVQNVDNQDDCVSDPSGDWFVTIDLKDAYFHVEILPQHRKFLRFAFGGEAYQYRVLPFGLALSPRTYTKCMDAALTPGHPHFKLQRRLADSGTVSRTCASTSRCRPSSSRISGVETQRQEKCSLFCSEDNVFGGCMGFDHDAGTAVSCTHRIHSKCPKEHQARPENYCSLPSEGSRSHGSCIHGDTLGLLHMRSFQLWLRARGFHPRANPQRQIRVTRQGLRTLSMWFRPRFWLWVPTLGPCCRRKMLTTDASLTGWGAVLDGRPAQGI